MQQSTSKNARFFPMASSAAAGLPATNIEEPVGKQMNKRI